LTGTFSSSAISEASKIFRGFGCRLVFAAITYCSSNFLVALIVLLLEVLDSGDSINELSKEMLLAPPFPAVDGGAAGAENLF
jgi:hypothetical protein